MGDSLAALPGSRVGSILDAVIDDQGRVAFTSKVRDDDLPSGFTETLLSERDGGLTLITSEDTLPGLKPYEICSGIEHLSGNSAGQLVFWSTFRPFCEDPDDPFACASHQGAGYWLVGNDGEAKLAIRTGDSIEVAPGDSRVVAWLQTINGPYLNDLGQFAFTERFLDGTQGVFRRQLVPEPSATALASFGMICLVAWRRRKTLGK